MGVSRYIYRCFGVRNEILGREQETSLESKRENKGRKRNKSSNVFWIFIILGIIKTIFIFAAFIYLYSSLAEFQGNITVLQKKMLSMEKVCMQLTRYAVRSRQQVDSLLKEKLKGQQYVSQDPYSDDDIEDTSHNSYEPYTDSSLEHLGRGNTTDNSTYNSSNSTSGNFIKTDDTDTQIDEEVVEEYIDGELCDMIVGVTELEEYNRRCNELHFHHGRVKRSNKRGKQKRRKSPGARRNQPHSTRGPVATHFKGGLPETFIQDSGLVAPWFPDSKASADFGLSYEFREGKGKVEVVESGLYIIYAQVYYLTMEPLNSYMINVKEKDSDSKPVAYCSGNAVVPPQGGVTEVSCYTSVIRYLNASTQVYLTQRDRNRRMLLRDGYTFLGLARLNKSPEPKRRQGNRS